MKNMLTTTTKSSIRFYTWATTWRPTPKLRHNMSATEAGQHPIPTNTHPHTSLSLAARPKTQEITQPPASHISQDTVIHSFQHLEPTLQHTSKAKPDYRIPPGMQHCYLQHQDSVIVMYNTPLTRRFSTGATAWLLREPHLYTPCLHFWKPKKGGHLYSPLETDINI